MSQRVTPAALTGEVPPPETPASPARRVSRLDKLLLALSAAGVPIGLVATRRMGRLGGVLLEIASGALFLRACVMVAAGTARRLQVIPAILLFAETIADGL